MPIWNYYGIKYHQLGREASQIEGNVLRKGSEFHSVEWLGNESVSSVVGLDVLWLEVAAGRIYGEGERIGWSGGDGVVEDGGSGWLSGEIVVDVDIWWDNYKLVLRGRMRGLVDSYVNIWATTINVLWMQLNAYINNL